MAPSTHRELEDGRVATVFRVRGRVQGVGYRYWALLQAEALSLVGVVRNLTDGSVEALVIGPVQDVARLATLFREGPAAAIVASVDASAPPAGAALDRPRFRRGATVDAGAPF